MKSDRARRVALAAVVSALFVVSPTSAAGVVPQSSDEEAPSARDLGVRALEELGAASWLTDALDEADEEEQRVSPYLRPAGDLDGDGADDIIALTRAESSSNLVMTGRRGRDGAELFSVDTGVSGVVPLVQAGPVGTDGDPGVLLVAYDFGFFAGASSSTNPYGEHPFFNEDVAVEVDLHLVAVGGDGTILWQRSFTDGSFAYTGTTLAVVENLPIFSGTFDAVAGGGIDTAVAVYNRTPSAENGQEDSVEIRTVDGADGSDAAMRVLDIDNNEARVATAPDLDGDGLEDLTVRLLPGGATPAGEPTLLALRGTDAGERWRSTSAALDRNAGVSAVGDMTGDGIDELAVGRGNLPFRESAPQTVSVVDGVSGAALPVPDADTTRALGDVDGDGKAEVLLSVVEYAEESVTVVHRAVRGDGTFAYERSYALDGIANAEARLLADPGDVDGDGVRDVAQRLRMSGEGFASQTEERIVSGRTGQTIRTAEELAGNPLRASIDGHGDDWYRVDAFGPSVVDISTVDGVTGNALATARLRPRGDETTGASAQAAGD